MSERRACRALGQHRSTQRKVPQGRADEERLTDSSIELADKYGRFGYRMVTGLLNNAGWHVNHKRVERIWRREGLRCVMSIAKKSCDVSDEFEPRQRSGSREGIRCDSHDFRSNKPEWSGTAPFSGSGTREAFRTPWDF